jgi:homocysteine S-methyltransferase
MQIDNILKDNHPFIIDGGLSNVLEEQGCDLNHKLWTANLLEKNPDAIIQAHLEYLKSGAQCITTSSYQASIPGLTAIGYDRNTAEKLILKSIQLAEIAIKTALDSGIVDFKPLIAASVGPYGAYLADGSEYRGNYGVSDKKLRDFHSERIRILDRSNADILACETIPSFQEARILSDILFHVDKPVWISFSCKDEQHLNDGSKIRECVSIFRNHPKVFAVGANCTKPKYISGIIQCIKASRCNKKIIVYPNSGEVYSAKSKTWRGLSEPKYFVEMSKEWTKIGADIIGGCCRIGPEHIRIISNISLEMNANKK